MRATFAAAATTLLVLAGCSTATESETAPAPGDTTPTPAAPAETPIAIGEPFTLSGRNYTAEITIERVYVPPMCGETANTNAAIQTNVDVKSGDGSRGVLDTSAIRERTPDGYLQKDRVASRSCDGVEELDAIHVQTGDKYRGVIWLTDDVGRKSELLINAPTDGEPISEVFVLDLEALDLEDTPSGEATVASPSVTAPAAAAEPTVVRCLEGTPGPALWSDGGMRHSDWCFQSRGGPAYLENEGNSGLYGPNHQELLRQSAEAIAEGRDTGDAQMKEGCRTGNINADTCALAGY